MGPLTVVELHNKALIVPSIMGTAPKKLVIIVVPYKDICSYGSTYLVKAIAIIKYQHNNPL